MNLCIDESNEIEYRFSSSNIDQKKLTNEMIVRVLIQADHELYPH
jgi:hypothetical protein